MHPPGNPPPPPTGAPPPTAEPPPVADPPPDPLTHWPELQTSPPPHVVHIAPPAPHFIADGVCTHMVPSQQPPQFEGPHVAALTQAPPKQVWLLAHWAHTPASEPHARFELPGVHAPASVTHPGQTNVMH